MLEKKLAELIIDLVPQWYTAECGPNAQNLDIGTKRFSFFSHKRLTPKLCELRTEIELQIPEWLAWLSVDRPAGAFDLIQESFALQWLIISKPHINWRKLFTHALQMLQRTYENQNICRNLVISSGNGKTDITDAGIQKWLDPIGTSQHSFLRTDRQLRFLSYEEIGWGDIVPSDSYKFHPEFLHPFNAVMSAEDVSVHLTSKGDLIVMDKLGILAAKRQGHWKIYDVQTLKNCISAIVGDYWVGCNIFEVMLDLSFKRHGALLIFDPRRKVLDSVVNKESVIVRGKKTADGVRQMLGSSIGSIALGNPNTLTAKKRLLLEIASIDGAVLFDTKRLLAFGAMIYSHPKAGNHAGARTTAALSAYHHGGHPIKISSDGDITVYFTSNDNAGQECLAHLSFL